VDVGFRANVEKSLSFTGLAFLQLPDTVKQILYKRGAVEWAVPASLAALGLAASGFGGNLLIE
jgi:hypothetical protein